VPNLLPTSAPQLPAVPNPLRNCFQPIDTTGANADQVMVNVLLQAEAQRVCGTKLIAWNDKIRAVK
jgi:hypothetical protein